MTALLCAVLFRLREHLVAAVFSLSAAAGICLFAFSGMLLNGFLSLWNQLAEVLGKKAGIYLTIYQLKDSGKANGELAVLIFLGIACGLFGFLILKLRWYVLLLLFAAVLPVVLVKTELLPDTRLCLGFYAGTLLELNYMTKNKGGNLGNAADVAAFIAGAFGLLLVSVFGGMFLQSLVPKNEYQDSQLVANAKEEALSGLSRLRYKGQGANSLPDGKLKQTGAWSASSDTALEITMEHPASLYLRGFVGSVYDGSSWTEISTEEAYEEKDLYYWLHQEGFYGQECLGDAAVALSDEEI